MAEMTIKRRPVRAALYGAMMGFSIWYFLQFQFAMFGLDSTGGLLTRAGIVIVVTMALSVAWAYVAPPRKAKGEAPASETPTPTPEVAAAPTTATETETETETEDMTPVLPSDDE